MDHDYDIIQIKEKSNPYHQAVLDAFKLFFDKNPDHGMVQEAENLVKSKKIFAVPCHYYQMRDPREAILVIGGDILVMVFKNKKSAITPISMDSI